MYKSILLVIVFITSILADTFNFTEVRYSSAIDKSMQLEGRIIFLKNGLKITYPRANQTLEYINNKLVVQKENQVIVLEEFQAQQIASYFNILIMIYNNDNYNEIFEAYEVDGLIYLTPKTRLKKYIKNIEYLKEQVTMKYIKIFLQNNDYIEINIVD